jgi:hypothetical protein
MSGASVDIGNSTGGTVLACVNRRDSGIDGRGDEFVDMKLEVMVLPVGDVGGAGSKIAAASAAETTRHPGR